MQKKRHEGKNSLFYKINLKIKAGFCAIFTLHFWAVHDKLAKK